jgi:dihydroflavonol-4-reductase
MRRPKYPPEGKDKFMDLVIGGCGLIGCRLVEALIDKERRVRVYDLAVYPADEAVKPSECVRGSILDLERLQEAMKGCQTVYHLAANPNLWARRPQTFDRVNRQGTENVIASARSVGPERLVYTSTESILAPRGHAGPIDESVQTTLEDMIGPYCRSKFLAERLMAELAESGFPAIIVNPTLPMGPCDRNLTPPGQMIRNFLLGKIRGYLDCVLNFVDVRDVAMGHILAAKHAVPGRRYILAGHNLHLKAFFQQLAGIARLPAPRFQVPYALALGFSYLEEAVGRLTGRVPMSSVTGVKLCRRSLAFDSRQTWQALGGSAPRPLQETLEDAVRWHRRRLAEEGVELKSID